MDTQVVAPTTIFRAREIITMNPSNPTATHVAVRDGRVLGAGSLDELEPWGPHVVDEQFADHVVVPGLIDVHTHLLEGALWAFAYVGYFPRTDPDGNVQGGFTTARSVVEQIGRLAAEGPVDEPLICWGFDPIYFPGERLVARHLDEVVPDRPVFLLHASVHVATVNSAMMRLSDITSATETEGVLKDAAGEPIGELQEIPAMMHSPALLTALRTVSEDAAYERLGRLATNAGMTTIGDMASMSIANPAALAAAERVVNAEGYPLRIVQYPVAAMGGTAASNTAVVEAFTALKARESEMLRYGGVKIVADGSIQGYTAVMNWPGYVTGAPNGLWQVPPDSLPETISVLHRAGIPVHVHCNGDAVIDAMIDAVDHALRDARVARPSSHRAALPAHHCRPVPADGDARDLRQHLRQPPLVLGRPALRVDRGARAGAADGGVRDRQATRRELLAARRRRGDPDRSAALDVVRREPGDAQGSGAG